MTFRVLQISQYNLCIPSSVQAFVEVCLSSLPNKDLLRQHFVFLIIDVPDLGLKNSCLSCLCNHLQFLLSTLSPKSAYNCSKASIFCVVIVNISPVFDALYIFLFIHLAPLSLYSANFIQKNFLLFYFALDLSIFIKNPLGHHLCYPLNLLSSL